MAKTMPLLAILSLFFFPISFSSFSGTRIELSYIDSKNNFTTSQLISRAVKRDKLRFASLFSVSRAATDINVPIHWGRASYSSEFAIGTPAQNITVLVDTGSDLIWTQCKSCTTCFSQPTPPYDPTKSSTYKSLSCNSTLCQALAKSSCAPDCEYSYKYGDGSTTKGNLATETFTFGSTDPVEIPNIGFGCGINNSNAMDNSSGILGLSRGPLSLVSQLDVGKFSYCLTSYSNDSTSPLLLGSLATLSGNSNQSMPFVKNPTVFPFSSFYYLPLQGITVGNNLLPISETAFKLTANGTGGFIIDSGTTITYLTDEVYQLVKKEVISQIELEVLELRDAAVDLCFMIPIGTTSVMVPKIIFHFDGADMELPGKNNFAIVDPLGLTLCFMMNSMEGISVFGNFQQQNMHILYDLANGVLSFEPADCNNL
ncbi:aspartic proteinase nepenthesin-1-like [Typha angustifolia]|uniref:aspartic proteinase nepenthesin-1-like n=1 Tax=Typha angustifolia TaxID=59011 RepID=UPI003C2D1594